MPATMCGRYTLIKLSSFLDYFSWIEQPSLFPAARYNIAPSQEVAVVTHGVDSPRVDFMRWGLVPSWAKDGSITAGSRMINARAESLAEKPAFRRLLKSQRCLVPADHFYEWKKAEGEKTKVPYCFGLLSAGPFAFAGLYDRWRSPEGQDLCTCTIITTAANPLMQEFHNRMPVILKEEHCRRWISRESLDAAATAEILCAYPSDRMTVHPVSLRVNKPGIDSPDLIEPVQIKPVFQPSLFGDFEKDGPNSL
jgi:putative SOS response-associated peptidase YedK